MKKTMFCIILFLMQLALYAQDTTTNTTVTKRSTTTTTTYWYMQPWVWVAGGAVFIIILVALFRGNSSTSREVSRTTVIKDDRAL